MVTLWLLAEKALEAIMALCLIAMASITMIDVVGRYFLNTPLQGGYEIVQYLMALAVFAALPLTTRSEGHLTISLFTDRLTGMAQRVHHVFVLAVSAMALALIAWRMSEQAAVMARSKAMSGSLGQPLAPIGWTMAGFSWLALGVCLILLVRVILGRGTGPKRQMEAPE